MSEQRSRSGGGPEVDLEQLAAFVDGRLDGEERAQVVKLLAASEQAREVVAEAMRIREEEEEESTPSAVPESAGAPRDVSAGGRSARSPRWKVWVPLAAAATIAGVAVIPQLRSGGPSTLNLARQVSGPGGELSPAWGRTRGALDSGDREQRGFRAGYHLAGVALAWTAGNRQEAERHLAQLRTLVEVGDVPGPALSALDRVERVMRESESAGHDAGAFESADTELEALYGPPVRLGSWAAAAELAAAAGDSSFFSSSGVRRPLENLAGQDWPVDISERIAALAAALDSRGDPDTDNLMPLIEALVTAAGS